MAEGEQSFWSTAPGILTGVAAVITAVGGVLAVMLVPDGNPQPSAGSGTAASSISESATAGGVPGTPSTSPDVTPSPVEPPGVPDAGELSGAATVELLPGDRFDVDTGVAGNAVDDEDVVYNEYNGHLYLEGARHAVVDSWTDQAGCTAALERRSDDMVSSERFGEAAVCMLTSDDVLAQVRPSEPAEDGRLSMDVIVWR